MSELQWMPLRQGTTKDRIESVIVRWQSSLFRPPTGKTTGTEAWGGRRRMNKSVSAVEICKGDGNYGRSRNWYRWKGVPQRRCPREIELNPHFVAEQKSDFQNVSVRSEPCLWGRRREFHASDSVAQEEWKWGVTVEPENEWKTGGKGYQWNAHKITGHQLVDSQTPNCATKQRVFIC